jgi:vacuolar protein-sorting-associated protein 4
MESNLIAEEICRPAEMTEGYSAADIDALCRNAALEPRHGISANGTEGCCHAKPTTPGLIKTTLLEMAPDQLARIKFPPVPFQHFQIALLKVRPSVTRSDLAKFEDWTAEFGQRNNYSLMI